jgi:hypothetical protein
LTGSPLGDHWWQIGGLLKTQLVGAACTAPRRLVGLAPAAGSAHAVPRPRRRAAGDTGAEARAVLGRHQHAQCVSLLAQMEVTRCVPLLGGSANGGAKL